MDEEMAEKKSDEVMQAAPEVEKHSKTAGYGKRPMWQWFLIYVVVAGVVYFVVYYLFFRNGSSY